MLRLLAGFALPFSFCFHLAQGVCSLFAFHDGTMRGVVQPEGLFPSILVRIRCLD